NCVGLIKQLPTASDPLSAITINSQLPHRISMVCRTAGARLIHISTDCVFDGSQGNYTEQDHSSATDLYGRTKFLGEVHYSPHCLTLRTSIIGHEFKNKLSLVEWFLEQKGSAKGFTKAVFSGLTTLEMAHVLETYVIPNPSLTGLYHLSVDPISKHDLISLIAKVYKKDIEILQDSKMVIDRSLNSDRFRQATGYKPPTWPELIKAMHDDFLQEPYYAREGN
ncbi:MAG TPA: SDR family oxidoreductase, partial [Candidatus Ozemobacteraceae bacterium]|nr:SDR family oxidoreductase [Candidatus Ozemobacteraceae bacterium]